MRHGTGGNCGRFSLLMLSDGRTFATAKYSEVKWNEWGRSLLTGAKGETAREAHDQEEHA